MNYKHTPLTPTFRFEPGQEVPRYLLERHCTRFFGWDNIRGEYVFAVTGPEACRAALRLLGVQTKIDDSFFDSDVGSHFYDTYDDMAVV